MTTTQTRRVVCYFNETTLEGTPHESLIAAWERNLAAGLNQVRAVKFGEVWYHAVPFRTLGENVTIA